jgi:phosphoenolpyruvate synthase/pyruvate phosphate dikinase
VSNKIRHYLKEQVQGITPRLHGCYRLIGKYQKKRNDTNQKALLDELDYIHGALQVFKSYVQYRKQPYFNAIGDRSLNISDRIIALDIAVGAMHIEFPVSRSYSHQESKELRNAIASTRNDEYDEQFQSSEENEDITGIPASSGVFTGKVKLVLKTSQYKRLPQDTVVVTKMTRPEFILGIDNIAAIITDQGGNLCHAAVLARELKIPCIVGTRNATAVLKSGQIVTVNGDEGIVEILKK